MGVAQANKKRLDLGMGCHLCEKYLQNLDCSKIPTMDNLNPHCDTCEKLYCPRHQSSQNPNHCISCLP